MCDGRTSDLASRCILENTRPLTRTSTRHLKTAELFSEAFIIFIRLTIRNLYAFLASFLLFVILFLPSFPLHDESFGQAFSQSRGACGQYVSSVFLHIGSPSLSCQHPFGRSPCILGNDPNGLGTPPGNFSGFSSLFLL